MFSLEKYYPQIFLAFDIIQQSRFYPEPPVEPQEPKPIDRTPPSKYPYLKDNLQALGFCLLGLILFLPLFLWTSEGFFLTFILFFGGTAILSLSRCYNSLVASKTLNKRLLSHQKEVQQYDIAIKDYQNCLKKYNEDKKLYDELMQSIKTYSDVKDFQLKHFQKYLQSVKSKERHKWFYDLNKFNNPKLGRGEYFFRDFINKAIANKNIPSDFDFIFDASIEVSSFNLYSKVSFFYPDLLVLTSRGLLIDVEIDEPYSAESKSPIHYIHSSDNNDSARNSYFTHHNCSVLRFTERQILKYPEICLRIILEFDDYASIPPNLNLPSDFKEKAWTKKESIEMAKNNYRDTY